MIFRHQVLSTPKTRPLKTKDLHQKNDSKRSLTVEDEFDSGNDLIARMNASGNLSQRDRHITLILRRSAS